MVLRRGGLALFFFAAAWGCAQWATRTQPSGFLHSAHVKHGISCLSCHERAETDAVAGMPTVRKCMPCHGPVDFRDPYPFEVEIAARPSDESFDSSYPDADLAFSHAAHLSRGAACDDCHGDASAIDRRETPARANPDDCLACHQQSAAHAPTTECSACHANLSPSVRPPSHSQLSWARRHGRLAPPEGCAEHRSDCSLCHEETDCSSCHARTEPSDHGVYFRTRGHGLAAEIDRERCATCHKEDFCSRCHAQAIPRSHDRASWGGSTANHCFSCHPDSLADAGCSACHRSTPSHALATPIPAPPHPTRSADCYHCHLRPPHSDNGMPCTACHR